MKKQILLLAFTLVISISIAISIQDIRFCLDRELFWVLEKHKDSIEELLNHQDLTQEDLDTLLEYAQRTSPLPYPEPREQRIINLDATSRLSANRFLREVYWQRTMRLDSFEDACNWARLRYRDIRLPIPDVGGIDGLMNHYKAHKEDYDAMRELETRLEVLRAKFTSSADSLVLATIIDNRHIDYLKSSLHVVKDYNDYIEAIIKESIDEISVERRDSLAIPKIEAFYTAYPASKWLQAAYYFHLHHLTEGGYYNDALDLIGQNYLRSPEHAYISALFLSMPALRRALPSAELNHSILSQAFMMTDSALMADQQSFLLLYDSFEPDRWQNKLRLHKAKLAFFLELDKLGLYGDEDELYGLIDVTQADWQALITSFENIHFEDNDTGELAELAFWKGRALALGNDIKSLESAASSFAQCLAHGAPRGRFDTDAWDFFLQLHRRSQVKTDPMTWARGLLAYKGITFEDKTSEYGLEDLRYSRIAIADYNNDGWHDLLFSGKYLYKNDAGTGFSLQEPNPVLAELPATGGLWADFNLDGRLDFVALSHDESRGEQLLKQQADGSFVTVNDRAGAVFDARPTEGAAWIDTDMTGYPSLYLANYEKWGQQAGYPDAFWQNNRGYFSDRPQDQGFHSQTYHAEPGLAGRGVAPADFDNDGIQEIYVTNYRLNRNFLWKKVEDRWIDLAALYGVQGNWTSDYYGHSIGADWGDFDNDGDLDLFVANLAHPRYIDFSDISILYRNDGLACRVIEADTLYYWQFTDITQEAGIKYDELHSDPLWFDADNDGDLDLYITSIYENERSYLYENLGDGTFQDITWLSGARVYNGWGNAMGDLNRDDLPDLVVASSSGIKVLINSTITDNIALWLKPIWDKGSIRYLTNYTQHSDSPNSPAYGVRYRFEFESLAGDSFSLIRELSGGKGTASQNAPEIHIGLGQHRLLDIQRLIYENPQN